MGAATRRAAVLAAVVTLALAGCAGRRIEGGVFHAPSGYRVAVPGGDWEIVADSRADLEVRHRTATAGMLVNAVCDPEVVRRSSGVLTLHLLFGLRDRAVMETNEVPVNGRTATHRRLEGRMRQSEERVRIESYTLKDQRCVYDLLYVAAPEAFDAWRADFARFVASFGGD